MLAVAKGRKRAAPAADAAPLALSRRRRIAFTAITLAIPLVLLLLLELGLRLAGYGGSYPLFVEYRARPEYAQINPDVARRYFRQSFVPTPEVEFFRADKPPGTFRIVFQGESSAQGFPYGHGGAPSRMLKQRLEATFPDRRVEIINTALTAINSHVLVDLADEIVAQRPDAVMIYTGHNEYYGIFGVGSTRGFRGARPLVKAYLALDGSRIVQLVGDAIGKTAGALGGEAADSPPRTVMEAMAGDQTIPYGSRRYDRGIDQFRANLRDLLARYRSAKIPVFIGTVASNERDQRPFVGGRTVGADTSADAFFALARAADERGDAARARAYYRAAKERDELRFRAPEAINRVIREEAARGGATVVETQLALERASPGDVVGGTLMLEHVHPNVDGYFLIADAFYEALRVRGIPGAWPAPVPAPQARRDLLVTPLDSLVGLFRTDRLLSAWPFRPRGASRVPAVDTLRPRTSVERLAQAVVLGNLPWPEAMERLRVEYERAGRREDAIRVARSMASEYSYSAEPLMDAARLALALRRYEDALAYVRAANERQESVQTANLLGLLLLRQGDNAGGVRQLRRASQLAPANERLRIALTAAEAIPNLERERARLPRDGNLLYNLAAAYAITQQYDKAREVLVTLERVAPAHAAARDLRQRLASVSP
jgi:tetratricopeptide (TPR) repeat protein